MLIYLDDKLYFIDETEFMEHGYDKLFISAEGNAQVATWVREHGVVFPIRHFDLDDVL